MKNFYYSTMTFLKEKWDCLQSKVFHAAYEMTNLIIILQIVGHDLHVVMESSLVFNDLNDDIPNPRRENQEGYIGCL